MAVRLTKKHTDVVIKFWIEMNKVVEGFLFYSVTFTGDKISHEDGDAMFN